MKSVFSAAATTGRRSPADQEHRPHDHFVQFYQADSFLIDSLSAFIRAGVLNDEAAVIIATPEHREQLAARLEAGGVGVSAAEADGRLTQLDAADTLARFMVNGMPDARRFADVIGDVLRRAGRGGRRIRAFGEMVSLLWCGGNREGAMRLEQSWNDIAQIHSFVLYCAYPLSRVEAAGRAAFEVICSHHTRTIA